MNSKKIGTVLSELRGKEKRENVAKDLGISVSALAMYENGNRIPKDEIKIKIAKYYNCTVEELFYAN